MSPVFFSALLVAIRLWEKVWAFPFLLLLPVHYRQVAFIWIVLKQVYSFYTLSCESRHTQSYSLCVYVYAIMSRVVTAAGETQHLCIQLLKALQSSNILAVQLFYVNIKKYLYDTSIISKPWVVLKWSMYCIKYANLSDVCSASHCPSVPKILCCSVLFDKAA